VSSRSWEGKHQKSLGWVEREKRRALSLGQERLSPKERNRRHASAGYRHRAAPLDQLDVNQLEETIVQAGLELMRQLLAQALTLREQQGHDACPHCGTPTVVGDGRVPFHLRTRFGTVPLARRQNRCPACRRAFRPLDTMLAGAGPGRATRGLVGTPAWRCHAGDPWWSWPVWPPPPGPLLKP
jgi:hypothetical protein